MAQVRTIQRQPDKLDYASPTQFVFQIDQLPKVEFFNVSANLPGISMTPTIQPTTVGRDIPIHGSKVAFEDLTIGFIVDEYLENYIQLHNWLLALGFPKDRSQYRGWEDIRISGSAGTLPGPPSKSSSSDLLYSDAVLTILSNKNNPLVHVRFHDIFPLSISGIDYDQNATDVESVKASATFAYQLYEIETI